MSGAFDPQHGLVIVHAQIVGPSGVAVLRLALDTGATTTLINAGMLFSLGYDPGSAGERVQITTGSGVEFVPQVSLEKVVALGRELSDFPVLSHTLPPSSGVDGLLGLDFFRGQKLSIDFSEGEITLG